MGIPDDLVAIDAYLVDVYRKYIGERFMEGIVRSRRDLFEHIIVYLV